MINKGRQSSCKIDRATPARMCQTTAVPVSDLLQGGGEEPMPYIPRLSSARLNQIWYLTEYQVLEDIFANAEYQFRVFDTNGPPL